MATCSEPKWLQQSPCHGYGRVSGSLTWMSASRTASMSHPDALSLSLPSRASACWAERGDHRVSHLLAQDLFSSVLSSSPRYMVQSAADGAHFVYGFRCLKITLAACCAGWHVAAQCSGEGQGAHRDKSCTAHGAAIRAAPRPNTVLVTHTFAWRMMGAGTWALPSLLGRDAEQDAKTRFFALVLIGKRSGQRRVRREF